MKDKYKVSTKVLSRFLSIASKQINIVSDLLVENKSKIIVGAVGSVLLIDDLHTKYKSRQYRKKKEEGYLGIKNAIIKQNSEIKEYRTLAEKVPDLLEINRQLKHALVEQGGTDNA